MSAITNTTISSYDYLLRQCYSSNRNARKAFGRASMRANDLAKVDSDALRKASRNLKDMEYSSENGVNIYNNIKAFVESYNNLTDSAAKVLDSPELTRMEKKLSKYIKNNKDELEKLGVKVSSSGKLTVDKETLLSTSASKVETFFSDDNEFSNTVTQHATRINRIMRNLARTGNSQTKKKPSTTGNTTVTPPVTTSTNAPATSIDFRA